MSNYQKNIELLKNVEHLVRTCRRVWGSSDNEPENPVCRDRVRLIVSIVCQRLDIDPDLIYSRLRPDWIVTPRHIAMSLTREAFPEHALEEIGRSFRRDHGTILHAMKKTQNRIDTEPQFKALYESLKAELEAAINPSEPVQQVA